MCNKRRHENAYWNNYFCCTLSSRMLIFTINIIFLFKCYCCIRQNNRRNTLKTVVWKNYTFKNENTRKRCLSCVDLVFAISKKKPSKIDRNKIRPKHKTTVSCDTFFGIVLMFVTQSLLCFRRTVVAANAAVDQNEVFGGRFHQRQLRNAGELPGRQH